jgi:hypothetical protein
MDLSFQEFFFWKSNYMQVRKPLECWETATPEALEQFGKQTLIGMMNKLWKAWRQQQAVSDVRDSSKSSLKVWGLITVPSSHKC